jgi:hypothetical protein
VSRRVEIPAQPVRAVGEKEQSNVAAFNSHWLPAESATPGRSFPSAILQPDEVCRSLHAGGKELLRTYQCIEYIA